MLLIFQSEHPKDLVSIINEKKEQISFQNLTYEIMKSYKLKII